MNTTHLTLDNFVPPTACGASNDSERLTALGRVYLDAGLPLAAAFEAAIADYRSFEPKVQCPI